MNLPERYLVTYQAKELAFPDDDGLRTMELYTETGAKLHMHALRDFEDATDVKLYKCVWEEVTFCA